MPKLIFIHGLNSTQLSFSYITSKLMCDPLFGNYDTSRPLEESIETVKAIIPNKPCILVGHSLGGLVAYSLIDHPSVKGVITISTPLGGSKAAWFAKWLLQVPVLHDIEPNSVYVKHAQKAFSKPSANLISTAGHVPFSLDQNDSIVTVSSQRVREKLNPTIDIKANHFEILQHPETVQQIGHFRSIW